MIETLRLGRDRQRSSDLHHLASSRSGFDPVAHGYALGMTNTWEYDIFSVTYGPGAGRTLEDAKSELNRRGAAGWEIVGNITTGYDADTGDLPHNIQPVLYLLAKRPTNG
jgi:hypothetical protein